MPCCDVLALPSLSLVNWIKRCCFYFLLSCFSLSRSPIFAEASPIKLENSLIVEGSSLLNVMGRQCCEKRNEQTTPPPFLPRHPRHLPPLLTSSVHKDVYYLCGCKCGVFRKLEAVCGWVARSVGVVQIGVEATWKTAPPLSQTGDR